VPANRDTSAQSPRIIASFFFRLQPLIRCSDANASIREGNSCWKTHVSGRRENV
jgi:hypothetical protein